MPAPLPDPYERVAIRIPVDDLAILRLAYPRKVNEVIRDLVHAHVADLRARVQGELPAIGGE